jgi:hypothetical protein
VSQVDLHCVRRHLEGSWDRWRKPGKRKRATRKSEERLFSICMFLLFVCSWFRVPFVEAAYGDGVAGFTSTCLFLPRVRFLWHRWEIIFETARGEIVSWRSPSLFTMGMLFYLFDRGRDVDDQLKFRLERKSVPAADGQRRAPS